MIKSDFLSSTLFDLSALTRRVQNNNKFLCHFFFLHVENEWFLCKIDETPLDSEMSSKKGDSSPPPRSSNLPSFDFTELQNVSYIFLMNIDYM